MSLYVDEIRSAADSISPSLRLLALRVMVTFAALREVLQAHPHTGCLQCKMFHGR